jgi:hypothetical protein
MPIGRKRKLQRRSGKNVDSPDEFTSSSDESTNSDEWKPPNSDECESSYSDDSLDLPAPWSDGEFSVVGDLSEDETCWTGTLIRDAQKRYLNILDTTIGDVITNTRDHRALATALYERILILQEVAQFWGLGGGAETMRREAKATELRREMYWLRREVVQARERADMGEGYRLWKTVAEDLLGQMERVLLGWSRTYPLESKISVSMTDVEELFPEPKERCFICLKQRHVAADCPESQSKVPIVSCPVPDMQYTLITLIRLLLCNEDGPNQGFSAEAVRIWVEFWGYDGTFDRDFLKAHFERGEDDTWTATTALSSRLRRGPTQKPNNMNSNNVPGSGKSRNTEIARVGLLR